VLDVSDDISAGTLVRRTDGVSTFDFTVMNARRKYDGVFMPNDRIIVMMRRITWLRVFTGYLNAVPLKTAWPREVQMGASCSLKRLQYWYWDAYTDTTQNMIDGALKQLGHDVDGSVLNVILTILDKVVQWPAEKVHIGRIPEDWYNIAKEIADQVDEWAEDSDALAAEFKASLGNKALIAGFPADSAGVGGSEAGVSFTGVGQTGFVGTLKSTKFGGVSLDATQRKNAELIVSNGFDILLNAKGAKGHEAHGLATALATSMVECGLRNLASDKYPESKTYPHDGSAPGDHDSVGLFQQRTPWGTIAERMDPAKSTTKFFKGGTAAGTTGLLGQSGWQKQSIGHLAQAVQGSAFPDRYAKYADMGIALVREMVANKSTTKPAASTGTRNPELRAERAATPSGTTTKVTSNVTGANALNEALHLVMKYPHIPYTQQYGGTRVDIISQSPPPGLDCSSFIQAVLYRALGQLGGCPRTSSGQAGWCTRIGVKKALNTQGALLFVSNNGKASGVHHVEMSLGNGKESVGAHSSHSHPQVGVEHYAENWSFGGLIPKLTYNVGAGGGPQDVGSSTSHLAGGTKHWPVTPHEIGTRYHQPGNWAIGYHTGIDIHADQGDRVEAIADGKVIQSGPNDESAYGNSVTQRVGDFHVMYCHLSAVSVTKGDQVTMGTKVGEVGNTGRSFGAHLHVEVRKSPYGYGDDVDPVKFISTGMYSQSAVGSDGAGSAGSTPSSGGADINDLLKGGWTDPPPASELPGFDPNDPIDALFGNNAWAPSPELGMNRVIANSLTGARALLNDQTVLPYLKNLFTSTMRSFSSAPNGDLIGWFPDYYGLWGTAAVLKVEPIEIQDFNVTWSDDSFVTHQFIQSGVNAKLDLGNGGVLTNFVELALLTTTTLGIANIDSPAIMQSLFGIKPENQQSFATWVYNRFGARPNFQQMDGLVGPHAEFFAAIFMFMRQWAYQYNADIPLTFMPEAWPGMLIQAQRFDFQAYITTVTHSFSFGPGGQFTTTVNIASPAYLPSGEKADPNHALFGLPIASGYAPGRGIGNPPPKAYQPYEAPVLVPEPAPGLIHGPQRLEEPGV
jgi:murein DD-endopeptidase MepM/ murein hydrolase activator NlpD